MTATTPSEQTQKTLHPFVTYDPHAMLKTNNRWNRIWHVAGIVTGVAFITFALISFLYASIYYPVHVPLVTILLGITGMPLSVKMINYCWDKKDLYAGDAAIDQKLIMHMKKLENSSYNKKLHPVAARFEYYCEECKTFLQKYMDLMKEEPRKSLKEINFNTKEGQQEYQQIISFRTQAKKFQEKTAICLLQAAYMLQILKNPYDERRLSDFFTFINPEYRDRLVLKDFLDSSSDAFLITPHKTYTIEEIFSMKPQQILDEIFDPKPRVVEFPTEESNPWFWQRLFA